MTAKTINIPRGAYNGLQKMLIEKTGESYKVTFLKLNKQKEPTYIATFENVHVDNLGRIYEQNTGLMSPLLEEAL